ncbi:MAG: di-heme oxidoredictase family protein [Gammaproteobacteria bacterium]
MLWHGGEARTSRKYFRNLPAIERAALLAFLNSL